MEGPLVHLPEPRAEAGEGEQLLGVVAEDVRWRHVHQRLDRLADHVHVVRVLVVRVRVVLAVSGDLLLVQPMVLGHEQVVAVLHGRERGRHQQWQEAVLGQLQVLDDLGPDEAQRVRERREAEARAKFLGDGRATYQMPTLDDERLQSGLGQIRPIHEAVVPATDHDGVVVRVSRAGFGRAPSRRSWRRPWRSWWSSCSLMSGRLSSWKVERVSGGPRPHVLVPVVHVHLQADLGPRRRQLGSDSNQGDVALEDGRIHVARGIADLLHGVVIDEELFLRAACGPWAPSGRRRCRSVRSPASRRASRSAASATSCPRSRARAPDGR